MCALYCRLFIIVQLHYTYIVERVYASFDTYVAKFNYIIIANSFMCDNVHNTNCCIINVLGLIMLDSKPLRRRNR